MLRRMGLVLAAVGVLGCHGRPLILYDAAEGRQWAWPYFLDEKPTVLAFWSTDEIECIDAIPALNTLNRMDSSVELVSVVVGDDRARIDSTLRGQYRYPVEFVALVDQEGRLARKCGVRWYPTYILYDVNGNEVTRSHEVATINNWFTRSRWLARTGAYRE